MLVMMRLGRDRWDFMLCIVCLLMIVNVLLFVVCSVVSVLCNGVEICMVLGCGVMLMSVLLKFSRKVVWFRFSEGSGVVLVED